ncbi:hypothetical protein ACERZ8_06475 [Tateyamaria armeniaca]|uniref:Holin n=1 Tax=Tateyamaria armeniaca TaxID=2518930 RepID=A0ABW8US09_9RHOB
MKRNRSLNALAFGGAAALLFQAVQNLFPELVKYIPVNESSFVQSAAIMLGALAISVIVETIWPPADEMDQGDQDGKNGHPPVV